QRSRWYKGYLQTWLVQVRRPVRLLRTIGWRNFIRFNLVLGGTPIIAVLNLVFWLITLMWFLGQPAQIEAVFPWYIYFPALIALVVYLAVGYWLQVQHGFILGDALSRVAAAQSVLFSRDPHLAAIGFIFTPLASMVQMPAIGLSPLWPDMTARAFSGTIMSAL